MTSSANRPKENKLSKSDSQPQIYKKLPLLMRDIGAVAKSQFNSTANYYFRSIDDVIQAIHPALISHGMFISFSCHDHQTQIHKVRDRYGNESTCCRVTLMLELTFWAVDGSKVSSRSVGEGLDEDGDKATAKAMATAMKYALLFSLMIPADRKESQADEPTKSASPQKNKYSRPNVDTPLAAELRGLMSRVGLARDEALALLCEHGVTRIVDLSEKQSRKLIEMLQKRVYQSK